MTEQEAYDAVRFSATDRQSDGLPNTTQHLDQRVDRELGGLLVYDVGNTRPRNHQNLRSIDRLR
jgi:hypothetical protein